MKLRSFVFALVRWESALIHSHRVHGGGVPQCRVLWEGACECPSHAVLVVHAGEQFAPTRVQMTHSGEQRGAGRALVRAGDICSTYAIAGAQIQ